MATEVGFCSVQHAVSWWTFSAADLASDDLVAGLTYTGVLSANSADIDTVVDAIGGSQISLPVGATVTGVSITVKFSSLEAGPIALPFNIQLRGPSGLLGTEKTDPGSTVMTTVTFGSSTDMWGAALTRAIINDAGFGVRCSIDVGGGPEVAIVYYLEITVHYTPHRSAEEKLDIALNAYAALTALVGTQIYRLMFVQGATFPLCVFQRVFTTKEQVVTGAIVSRSVRFQVKCYSESSREATEIAEEVEAALVAAIGTFEDVTLMNEHAAWEPDAELYYHLVEADCLEAA